MEIAAQGRLMVARPLRREGEGTDDGEEGGTPKLRLPRPLEVPRGRNAFQTLLESVSFGADVYSPRLHMPYVPGPIAPRDPEGFYYRGNDLPAQVLELTCEFWRHGRPEAEFEVIIVADQDGSVEGLLTFTIHAANLSDALKLPIKVSIKVQAMSTLDAVQELVDGLTSEAAE